jgi:hypothetical protein
MVQGMMPKSGGFLDWSAISIAVVGANGAKSS